MFLMIALTLVAGSAAVARDWHIRIEYFSCRIAGVRMESTVCWIGSMLFSMFLVMMLVIAFPALALWLPARLGY